MFMTIRHGKADKSSTMRRGWATAVAFIFCSQQLAAASGNTILPTGGLFTSGSGSILTSANTLTINQSSLRGIVDWTTFSIGTGGKVLYQNGTGATLNLVNGGVTSQIMGTLLGTGSVYVINPAGILIGPGARINTGGDFAGSTLPLKANLFTSGGALHFAGDSSGAVVNLGQIFSERGSVFLLGKTVTNAGSILAPNGTAGLAAGSEIFIKDTSDDQRVFVRAAGGNSTNTGSLQAAQIEVKAKGGNVYALAGRSGQIAATGTATIGGAVWLISDGGAAAVKGAVSAHNANGLGGTIETSGRDLDISQAVVRTGQGGNWLLDPVELNIDPAAAATIANTLATTNVTVETSATGATGPGTVVPNGNGDINVQSNIGWSSANALTLSAYRNVSVANGITLSNSGSGGLTLRADNAATGSGQVLFNGSGKVDFSGSTGAVSILYDPPGGYASPVSYAGSVLVNPSWVAPANGSLSSQLTAYMLVNNVTDLANLSLNRTGTYGLGANIDAASVPNFTPLWADSTGFTGTLDGRGQSIAHLTLQSSGPQLGLFGFLGAGGIVRNLNLTNLSMSSTGGGSLVGGIAAASAGTLFNDSASGTLQSSALGTQTGGLIGQNTGAVWSSSASGSVTVGNGVNGNNSYAGGLVGYGAGGGTINGSYATSVVTAGAYARAGGLAGASQGAVTACYASGNVNATGNYSWIGGLIGDNQSTVTGSYATGNITGQGSARSGGLIGNSGGAVSNSYATGSVSAQSGDDNLGNPCYSGGLIGYTTAAGTVTNAYASGAISGVEDNVVGGLVGRSSGVVTGSHSSSNLTIVENGSVGGLIGQEFAALDHSYATGTVNGGTNVLAGGLVARGFGSAPISYSYASGAVTSGDGSVSGGLTAWNAAPISNSYATGAVTSGADGASGGLSGNNFSNGIITNSYATGAVVVGANGQAGGLTGENDNSITNSYATGSVHGGSGSYVGGLSGYIADAVSNAYATGAVAVAGGGGQAGGLAGYAMAPITNTYARGSVAGGDTSSVIGGLVGYLDVGATVATSYATGAVGPSSVNAGGLIGQNASNVAVTASYWDTTTSGLTASAGGTGLTTRQWLTNGPFAAANSAWDFATTWVGGYPYPVLKTLPYVVASLTTAGARTYYGTDPAYSVSSAVDQNGVNALGSIAGGLIPVTVKSSSGIGTYHAGGSGQTAAGHQLTYLGSLTIDPATLTLTGLSAANKVYDGSANAALSLNSLGLSGLFGSDVVTLSDAGAAGVFADQNAGSGKPVSVSGITIGGAASANYVLRLPAIAADITPAPLTMTFSAAGKVYDGTTKASGSLLSGLNGVIGSDSVSYAGTPAFNFSNANAGTNKTVTGSGLTLTGAQRGNYTLQLTQIGTDAITPATLYYLADAGGSRPFGTANPAATGAITGLVPGDTLSSVTGGVLVFTNSSTEASTAGNYGIYGGGLTLTSGNYTLAQASGNANAFSVNPVTVSIGNVVRLVGQPNPSFSIRYDGPDSPYLDSLLAGIKLISNAPANDTPGVYQITALIPSALSGSIVVQPGALTIGLPLNNSAQVSPLSVASVPAVLQTIPPLIPPALTSLGSGTVSTDVTPVNAIGSFQVTITPSPDWGGPATGGSGQPGALAAASFAQSAPDGHGKGNKSTYAAGAQ